MKTLFSHAELLAYAGRECNLEKTAELISAVEVLLNVGGYTLADGITMAGYLIHKSKLQLASKGVEFDAEPKPEFYKSSLN